MAELSELIEYPVTEDEAFQPKYVNPVDVNRGYSCEYPAQWEIDVFEEALWEYENMPPEEDDIWEEI